MMRSTGPVSIALVACAVAALTAGCDHVDHHADANAGAAAEAAEAAGGEPTVAARAAAVEATLEAADALDGETDGVITRCPGCSLAMDGKAEHARSVGEYELHFCSASCADHFTEDSEASLAALQVPDSP